MVNECRKTSNSNKYLIYFHGNAEDIFNNNYSIDLVRTVLPFNTLCVEYPGYSIYSDEKSSKTIEEDSLIVFDFLLESGIKEKDIIICGRSIGSGPSIYLSSNRNPGALVLISPFKSLGEVVRSLVGIFKHLVMDRFPNIDIIDKIKCPTLFIHGQKDDIVPFDHSLDLSKRCKCPIELILPEDMDHNEINVIDDFIEPLTSFLQRNDMLNKIDENDEKILFAKDLYDIPKHLEDLDSFKKSNNDYFTNFIRNLFGV